MIRTTQKVCLAILIIVAIIVTYLLLQDTAGNLSPIVANELAMKQMEQTELSSFYIQEYQDARNVFNFTPILIFLVWCIPVGFLLFIIFGPSRKSVDEG